MTLSFLRREREGGGERRKGGNDKGTLQDKLYKYRINRLHHCMPMYYVNTHPDACTTYGATILCQHVLPYLAQHKLIWLKAGCWQNSPLRESHDHLGQFKVTKMAESIGRAPLSAARSLQTCCLLMSDCQWCRHHRV